MNAAIERPPATLKVAGGEEETCLGLTGCFYC